MTGNYSFVSRTGERGDPDSLLNADMLAFDIEGSGVHTYKSWPYGFSLAPNQDSAYYAPIENEYFRFLLANPDRLYLGHNVKFDRSMMKKMGVVIDNVACTMVAAHLCLRGELSLESLSLLYLNNRIKKFTDLEKHITQMTYDELALHFGSHAANTFGLWLILEKEMERLGVLDVFWDIEMPLVPVLSDMELDGVAVDADKLNEVGKLVDNRLEILEDGLAYWSGGKKINYNSPAQVSDLFYGELGFKPPWYTRPNSRPSVDKRYLTKLIAKYKNDYHRVPEVIPLYLKYKEMKTLKNSYVNSLLGDIVDGRVYGSFNQARAGTGRLSSSNPNLQKIPVRTDLGKMIREAFVAPYGKVLVKVDYDQIEFAELAVRSRDPILLDAFKAGRDMHMETAMRAFKDPKKRSPAKTLNFQIIYGGGSIKERRLFALAFPTAMRWIESVEFEAAKVNNDGYHIASTLAGRKRVIIDTFERQAANMISPGGREAVSTAIQGSAAEEVKKGMRKFWEKTRDTDVKMVLQVHDEIIVEVPIDILNEVIDVAIETMVIRDYDFPLRISISTGTNWGNMTEVVKGAS